MPCRDKVLRKDSVPGRGRDERTGVCRLKVHCVAVMLASLCVDARGEIAVSAHVSPPVQQRTHFGHAFRPCLDLAGRVPPEELTVRENGRRRRSLYCHRRWRNYRTMSDFNEMMTAAAAAAAASAFAKDVT